MGYKQHKEKYKMANRLYVGNLPYSATETDLSNFFATAGTVEKTILVIDRETKKPRGFGFVDMASEEGSKKAIETLNGAEMNGRPLVVNEAKPREDRPSGGNFSPRGHGHGGHKPHHHVPRQMENDFEGSRGGKPRFDERRDRKRIGWKEDRRRSRYEDDGGY